MSIIKQMSDTFIFNTYARHDIAFVRGEGPFLWDEDGNRYTDFLAGIAVCSLGHCHPAVTRAIEEQARTLVHTSNLFYTEPQARLAKALVDASFADRVFFCNSGAEANEAAIKLARRYFAVKGEAGRTTIVTMKQSFHGRTMATLSATGQDKIKDGFAPLVERFIHVPFNDIQAIRDIMDRSIMAVMLEPVQGEGGIVPADPDYLKAVKQLCTDNGSLLIYDEVQCGMGRCGTLFAHQDYGVEPDIMTLAKALGNGLPIGTMLATDEAATGFAPGSHASTFGGTPLVTRAALAVLDTINQPDFLETVRSTGEYFRAKLEGLKQTCSGIVDIRGKGLLVGLEVDRDVSHLAGECLKKGFIINVIQGKVLRFAPPLIIPREEIDRLTAALESLLQ